MGPAGGHRRNINQRSHPCEGRRLPIGRGEACLKGPHVLVLSHGYSSSFKVLPGANGSGAPSREACQSVGVTATPEDQANGRGCYRERAPFPRSGAERGEEVPDLVVDLGRVVDRGG